MTTNRPLRVFLCHSSADKPAVRELYQKLRAEPWIQPWLDEEELFPGMDWKMEIEKAIRETDAILVCLSRSSITKEGYVQKEIKSSLDYSDEKPEGTVYIIPIRLEECVPPPRLSKWQYSDYFEGQREKDFQRILLSLKRRSDSLLHIEEKNSISNAHKSTLNDYLHLKWASENKISFSNGMEFICVPAGKFLMGSDNSGYDNEKPQHIVDIPYDYWMARFPVTNELYNAYITSRSIYHPVAGWENKKEHPVTFIEWADAMAYCQWLNSLIKVKPQVDLILRLPSEAEWEKAARGIDGREYPWGNKFDKSKCNTREDGQEGTTIIGKYSPQGDSQYGFADMAGNVWEWTHSLKKNYPYFANDGREDEINSGDYVLRGGSFYGGMKNARCACRYIFRRNTLRNSLGFRVCIAPLFSS